MDARRRLESNLQGIEARIAAACARASRARADVTLVAVTKSVRPDVAAMLVDLGVVDLGESRPQVLWTKAAALPGGVRWHMIGHLQRNKIERTLPLVHLTHSVDSLRLLEAIETESARCGRVADVLLEFNVSREPAKAGFAPEAAGTLVPRIRELKACRVRGLMTMAAIAQHNEQSRPTFAELRRLRDGMQSQLGGDHDLSHLSMGMSDDFEVAIEEGATHVRIGSALFEGLP